MQHHGEGLASYFYNQAIQEEGKENVNNNVLVVSHAHFIKGLLISLNDTNYQYTYSKSFPNTSYVKLDYVNGKLIILDMRYWVKAILKYSGGLSVLLLH